MRHHPRHWTDRPLTVAAVTAMGVLYSAIAGVLVGMVLIGMPPSSLLAAPDPGATDPASVTSTAPAQSDTVDDQTSTDPAPLGNPPTSAPVWVVPPVNQVPPRAAAPTPSRVTVVVTVVTTAIVTAPQSPTAPPSATPPSTPPSGPPTATSDPPTTTSAAGTPP